MLNILVNVEVEPVFLNKSLINLKDKRIFL